MDILPIKKELFNCPELFLRTKSKRLTKGDVLSDEFQSFARELLYSLYASSNGVGLAAPQVGRMIKVAVIDTEHNGKSPLLLINPVYEPVGDETVDSTEGCLSFPGVTCIVKRYKKVRVTAKDIFYNDFSFEDDEFLSIVCQHEIDHLNGIVFLDRATKIIDMDTVAQKMADRAFDVLISGEDAVDTAD